MKFPLKQNKKIEEKDLNQMAVSQEGRGQDGKNRGWFRRSSDSRSVDPGDANNNDYYKNLDSDAAETAVVSSVDERGRNPSTGSDGFRPAVKGERAPLGVDNLGAVFGGDPEAPSKTNAAKRPDFKSIANKVRTLQKVSHMSRQASQRSLNSNNQDTAHRRAHSLLASIDEVPQQPKEAGAKGSHEELQDKFGIHKLKDASDIGKLDTIFDFDGSESELSGTDTLSPTEDGRAPHEGHPLLGGQQNPNAGSPSYRSSRTRKLRRRWKKIRACINPATIPRRLMNWLLGSYLIYAIPFWLAALFLFYDYENLELDFLPGTATLSWWANFIGRQLLLLEVANIIQYLLIDCLALSTKFVLNYLGPWVTLFCLQSRGWPCLLSFWGLLDMLLLHGDNEFQQHWLYFTGIRIYSSANSGSYILQSEFYLRFLISMVFTGVAMSFKRTIVTLYFGKRNLEIYKPQLEEILGDIIVITEVAELAAEADNMEDLEEDINPTQDTPDKRASLGHARWSSLKFTKDGTVGREPSLESIGTSNSSDIPSSPASLRKLPYEKRKDVPTTTFRDSSRLMDIKNLLDRWEEPASKLDKVADTSVDDILKFRKALTYMDLEYPFSESFGLASNRDELIASAQKNYERLLKLSPGSTLLPYSVLAALYENDDGSIDREKKRSLQKLFRPDMDDEVPLLSFIQSCDSVYKKLRYFRASVGNSSVIDKKLENIINAVFFFMLGLLVLLLLNFNPWPLLVSMSTLLVTFAFAVGPSAAKAIEGILLIVGRRPFDIGDRILISDSPGAGVPEVTNSWMVEDITLFCTTLRFGATNEVATISNGSIAGSRITNFARSKNAMVHVLVKLSMSFHENGNMETMKEAIEKYVRDNQNIWDSIVFFRCEEIDTDNCFVRYKLAVRSRHTWQVASRVLMDRARMHQYIVELAKKMKVLFAAPDPSQVIYYGGKYGQSEANAAPNESADSQQSLRKISSEHSGSTGSSGSSASAGGPGQQRLAELGAAVADDENDAFLKMVREAQS